MRACVMPTNALTKNSTNGASFVACKSVDPAITAMASAMEGKAGSSAGVFGTSCVKTRALLPLPSTVPSFSARPIFHKSAVVISLILNVLTLEQLSCNVGPLSTSVASATCGVAQTLDV